MEKVVGNLALFLIFLIASCDTGLKKLNIEESEFPAVSREIDGTKAIKPGMELLFLQAPNPCEIPFLLKSTKVEFNPLLVQEIDNIGLLENDEVILSLNLGFSSTDFAYLASFGQPGEALVYLDFCKVLADCLNVTTAFDYDLIRKIEENINQPEELERIVRRESRNVSKYLRGDYRSGQAVFVLTGGVIENIYISSELLRDSISKSEIDQECAEDIIKLIMEQGFSLHGILGMLDQMQSTEEIKLISEDLTELNTLIDQLQGIDVNTLDENLSWLQFLDKIRSIRSNYIADFEIL